MRVVRSEKIEMRESFFDNVRLPHGQAQTRDARLVPKNYVRLTGESSVDQ